MPQRPFAMLLVTSLLLALWATPAAGQEIYVTQDEQGNPVYSDRPSRDAAPIRLRESNIYEAQPVPEARPRTERRRSEDRISYSVRITQPENEEAIRAPEGRVQVEVSVEPGLRSGHRLKLLRNGSPVPGEGSSFSVQTYDRGANEFVAVVMDEEDRELARSAAVTVYLLRRGLLSPAPANPAPNFRPLAGP
ncbi:MAG: DUF4124 domain-containing protein [Gammaproteobacteria bacterium]|nr:DUF4124 domain-containing protein [Gammaproteobacteria bacterium]